MKNISKAITLGLFLFSASYQKLTQALPIFGQSNGDTTGGLIELDLEILKKPKDHLNDVGMQLMNLAAASGDYTPNEEAFIEMNLYAFFDIQLYSNIYVGSNREKFEMIFDTGSSWVWVQSDQCHQCMANEHKFHMAQSETFKLQSQRPSQLRYGKGTVFGYDSTDQVCITPNGSEGHGCMNDYLFKSVFAQRDLSGLAGAGIIGLSPSNTKWDAAQLFVPSLYHKKAIKENMFALFIDQNGQSKIQMGGYDLKKYAQGPIHWHSLSDHLFWQMKFDHVKIGDFHLKPSINQIMADSGTSLNMIPDQDFRAIFDHFFKGKLNCHKSATSLTICDCTREEHEKVPDLQFHIDNVPYIINRDQWFERSENKCVIKLMHGAKSHHWILGLNFFTNYYTVFDYDKKKLGFAKSVIAGSPPSRSFMRWVMGTEAAAKAPHAKHHQHIKKSSSDSHWTYICKFTVAQFALISLVAFLYAYFTGQFQGQKQDVIQLRDENTDSSSSDMANQKKRAALPSGGSQVQIERADDGPAVSPSSILSDRDINQL